MGLSTPDLDHYLTVAEAAEVLGVRPWDVMRLVEEDALRTVVLIDRESLSGLKESS